MVRSSNEAVTAAPAGGGKLDELDFEDSSTSATSKPAPATSAAAAQNRANVRFEEIKSYGFDNGEYSCSEVTVDIRLKGVEQVYAADPINVTYEFTATTLDLRVYGLDGSNYRFKKVALQHDILPAKSSMRVKKNHVILTLAKIKTSSGGMMVSTTIFFIATSS